MSAADSVILTYHSIDPSGSVVSVSPSVFQAHMLALKQSGTTVVPLSRIASTPGAVAITFDDGFRNFRHHALPTLMEYRFPSTVFAVSGYSGRSNSWAQPFDDIPTLDLMSDSELAEISRMGVEIGAHTASHAKLTEMSPGDVEKEMICGKESLERITGKPVNSFAYPYGACSSHTRKLAQIHFQLACGVQLAAVRKGCDLYELPRVDAYYVREMFWFNRLGSPMGATYLFFRRVVRNLRSRFLAHN